MANRKSIRTRGKLPLSKYFQKLNAGDSVAVTADMSVRINFPERLQGRTGVVAGKRGKAYVVKMKDQNKEKTYLIESIHLKKIKTTK